MDEIVLALERKLILNVPSIQTFKTEVKLGLARHAPIIVSITTLLPGVSLLR
jgi:hypothetical protein